MEIIPLGTSSGWPTKTRNVSSVALRLRDGTIFLFDCGEGTQHQVLKSNIKPGKIDRIFISHLHGDHVFGLPGFLCTLGNQRDSSRGPVHIYGPKGLKAFIRVSLLISQSNIGFEFYIHELMDHPIHATPSSTPEISQKIESEIETDCLYPQYVKVDEQTSYPVWNLFKSDPTSKTEIGTGGCSVVAGALSHRIASFGFVIQENDLPGKLDAKKCASLGMKAGPDFSKLKNGQSITLPDGSIVHAEDVVGPPTRGTKIVIMGDTNSNTLLKSLAMDCDALYHEATHEDQLEEKAKEYGHSTPRMAAEFAREVNCKLLILTHFSSRYHSDSDSEGEGEVGSVAGLVLQAQKTFQSGNVVAALDLTPIAIKSSQIKLNQIKSDQIKSN